MNALQIAEALMDKKGRHVRATWSRACKTFKGCPYVIAKRTSVFVRTGINYEHLSTVQNGIEKGERGEVQALPWGNWREGCFPYIIDHNGTEYIRLYPATFDNLRPSVEYTKDGLPTTFDEIKEWLLASEYPKDERAECFTVKAESIIEIADFKGLQSPKDTKIKKVSNEENFDPLDDDDRHTMDLDAQE